MQAPSLLAAALGTLDPREPVSTATIGSVPSSSDGPSRLSQVSSGSTEAPLDEYPELPIGYAQ